jgi:hypothetical protein
MLSEARALAQLPAGSIAAWCLRGLRMEIRPLAVGREQPRVTTQKGGALAIRLWSDNASAG